MNLLIAALPEFLGGLGTAVTVSLSALLLKKLRGRHEARGQDSTE